MVCVASAKALNSRTVNSRRKLLGSLVEYRRSQMLIQEDVWPTSECLTPSTPSRNTTTAAMIILPLLLLPHASAAFPTPAGDCRGDMGIASIASPAMMLYCPARPKGGKLKAAVVYGGSKAKTRQTLIGVIRCQWNSRLRIGRAGSVIVGDVIRLEKADKGISSRNAGGRARRQLWHEDECSRIASSYFEESAIVSFPSSPQASVPTASQRRRQPIALRVHYSHRGDAQHFRAVVRPR